jgi:FkbM family methyltransferase
MTVPASIRLVSRQKSTVLRPELVTFVFRGLRKLNHLLLLGFSPYFKSRLLERFFRQLDIRIHLDKDICYEIWSQSDWWVYQEVFVAREYDNLLLEVIAKANPDEPVRVMDLGANAGFFTARLAALALHASIRHKFEMLLVEAAPHLARSLPERLKVIPGDLMSITVVEGLVGKKEGTASLLLAGGDIGNSVGNPDQARGWMNARGAVPVPYVDLNELAWKEGPIDLVKCDIEGGEFDFVENYPELLKRTRRLQIEIHRDHGNSDSVLEKLTAIGFKSDHTIRSGDKIILLELHQDL